MNMNNELNARFHRTAVIDMFAKFKEVADEMKAMLELPLWYTEEERKYDRLKDERHSLVVQLKRAGMFL